MAKRRRRRNWDDEEKRMICAQTRVSGVSVSQVARRYDVNANQVFNWLKEPRFADSEPREPARLATTAPVFLPVEIIGMINLSVYSQKDLDKIADSLNNRPRKVLGIRTPLEVYQTEISDQSVALQN